MNAGRIIAFALWGLMGTALAAEPATKAEETPEKQSTGLLQARMTTQQKTLESAEAEMTTLRQMLRTARARQAEVQAQKFDSARFAPLLTRFQKDFAAVSEVTTRGGLPTKDVYQRLERSANDLTSAMTFALVDYLPQHADDGQRSPLMDEVYGEPKKLDMPSALELKSLQFPAIGRDAQTPEAFLEQMRESVASASERAKSLSLTELERLFTRDRDAVAKVWQDIMDRAQAGLDARFQQVKDAQGAIDTLSTELDARQLEKVETDARLNWAVISMIVSLSLLFISTRFFTPEVQAIIFQQRTLIEMVGMAFLLLTIIILATDDKIDKAVLGTLLGTVGGYIFGQQSQARRNAAEAAPRPEQAPSAPAQPQPAAPAPQPPPVQQALPVAPTVPPQAAAVLLQQAAQQVGNPEVRSGSAAPLPSGAERTPPAAEK
ncbi:hypothetical protein [Pyxidicoccus xibeiensis]|uniref:hypothetical protein n=1 Tax=Pyxidicoccus xibeiensis TaxID=2906759 RepID=UPI0020A77494|nr:hypothetical protein [Pyxidicoccus xibeiensis]MCP3143933.1 hypothetical protein [Pyxidicoccus xibeiensis]